MKKQTPLIYLSKIVHRNQTRIKVVFPKEQSLIDKVKTIEGRKWSKTKNCWHVPYDMNSFEAIKKMFGEETLNYNTNSPNLTEQNISKKNVSAPLKIMDKRVQVLKEHKGRVKVLIPWQQKDWIEKIKSLPDRAWNKEEKYWSVPETEATLKQLEKWFDKNISISNDIKWSSKIDATANTEDLMKKLFKKGTVQDLESAKKEYQKLQKDGKEINAFYGEKIIIEKGNEQWLKVYVPYDKKGWIDIVRNITGRTWDTEEKCWIVPYVKDSLERLGQIDKGYIAFTFVINNEVPEYYRKPIKKKKTLTTYEQLNEIQKRAVSALENRLMHQRCSWRTIKNYKNHLMGLLLFYPKVKPSQISKEQIEKYILHRIKTRKISESTQNQLISGLKAFYDKVLSQPEKVEILIRPKKTKTLPNVFSKEELSLLINSISNKKHKVIISIIYSGGLRKGEVLKLRKKDILFSRKCIFVKDAKGKKDRFVMLAPKIENMLKEYLKIYQPKYWLFEGQTGTQYSESSIQSIFNAAKEKSKVNPYVTIHGLRHSFGTHLHAAGVPLDAIKDLMGHSSIKTTELYIHLSNQFMQAIQSPFEDLDLD